MDPILSLLHCRPGQPEVLRENVGSVLSNEGKIGEEGERDDQEGYFAPAHFDPSWNSGVCPDEILYLAPGYVNGDLHSLSGGCAKS